VRHILKSWTRSNGIKKIEKETVHLSATVKAHLIQKLVQSIDSPSVDELKSKWLSVARDRAAQLDSGTVTPVPSDVVLNKAQALIK
jgi:hypothetical protein